MDSTDEQIRLLRELAIKLKDELKMKIRIQKIQSIKNRINEKR